MELNQQHRNRRILVRAGFGVLLAIVLVVGLARTRTPPRQVQLPDGRILQIEAVTFGTNHQVGSSTFIFRLLAACLPPKLGDSLPMVRPASRFHLGHPILMVWINALDPTTGKYVDCQQGRMEIVDDQGTLYGGACYSSKSESGFWRSGYGFEAFPRTQREFTLQITPWDTNRSTRIQIPNPHLVIPAAWSGGPLPQTKTVGTMEVGITGLVLRTNVVRGDGRETPCPHWEPVWELRESGQAANGWSAPEWNAEDPTGNRSHFLGVKQPILCFDAKYYPSTTNTRAAVVIGTCPPVALDTLQSNVWWNLEIPYRNVKITVLGLGVPGAHVFSEGKYVSEAVPGTGLPSTGGSSGWEGFRRSSPWKVQPWSYRHKTPVPTLYLAAPKLGAEERLGVRIRDEWGHYWTTKIEPNERSGQRAYLLEVPSTVKTVVAEIVVLRPIQVEFFVRTSEWGKL